MFFKMMMEVKEMATKRKGHGKVRLSMGSRPTPAEAFFNIPLGLIIVEGQIRSRIDEEGESFLALLESIREKGVLEPIIVTPQNGNYRLISGERRLRACQMAGLPTIPARVLDAVTAREEILALQLTENLQREDLDPIDTALAVVEYFQSRHGEKGFDVNGIIDTLINLERDPNRVKEEIAGTVTAILNISGKSITSLRRTCSLLRLPTEIQNALREGRIGVSQGYIFAANLGHPRLMEIFQAALGEGFTNADLEKELKKETKPTTGGVRKRPFSLYRRSVRSVKSGIEGQVAAFKKSDLEALLSDLRELVALVEGRLPEALDDGGAVKAPAKASVKAQAKAQAKPKKNRLSRSAYPRRR
jgi:ParB-like chromosome segregation protein Spo0J